ncbi:Holliday junction resolvase RuvX [soil metagenome]
MGRIMAVDYGTKRTGLAVTDPSRIIATALDTVPTHQLFAYLHQYFTHQTVDTIVVGDPRRLNNESSSTTVLVNQFVVRLQKEFPVMHIARYDERFTSLMASRSLIESGQSRKVRRDKGMIDRVSATILLQNYLASLSSSSERL